MTRPENGGFILNRKLPASLLCNYTGQGYNIENAFFGNPNYIWKSDGSLNIYIKMTFANPIKLSGCGIINHTIPATATVVLHYYHDAFLTYAGNSGGWSWNEKNMYKIITEVEYQYYSLSIALPGSSAIQIGEIHLGDSFQFPHNFSWGYEEEFEVVKKVDTTDEGVHYETPDDSDTYIAPSFSKLQISFDDTKDEYYPMFKTLIMPGKKIFIKNYTKPDCHFGIVPNTKLKAKKKRTGDSYSIEFWEDAIGGLL